MGGRFDLLQPQGQGGDLLFAAGLLGLPGIIEDVAAHHHQDDHKGEADVEVGAGLAPCGQDHLLDLDAHPDPDAGGGRHHQAQLDVHLAVFKAFVGAHHGLGELVAHVAGHRHRARHPQAHHAGGQDEGAAGADEAAHQAADKAHYEQEQDVHGVQVYELHRFAGDIMHLFRPPDSDNGIRKI